MSVEPIAIAPIRQLLSFPFQDAAWRNKLLLGSVLVWANVAIPFLPMLFVYGYSLRVMRQTIKGRPPSLPDWDDWGGLASEGLQGMLIGLVYLLPGLVVLIGSLSVFTAAIFAGVPLLAIAGAAAERDSTLIAIGLIPVLAVGGSILFFLAMAVGYLLMFAGTLPLPAAVARFLDMGQLSAAFQFREIWSHLKSHRLSYIAAWVVVFGLFQVSALAVMLSYFTIVLICLAPLVVAPVQFYILVVAAALFGQTYREALAT